MGRARIDGDRRSAPRAERRDGRSRDPIDAGGAPIAGTCDASVPQIQTTDPGRALVTGKWGHVATFKGPILRGLSGRAPYFHNGSAATLSDVVTFYESRFAIGLTEQEKADLVAFLAAL